MKNNKILYIIIAVLVVIIFLQRSCSGNSGTKDPIATTVRDTVWVTTVDTVQKEVKVTEIKYIPLKGTKYQPSTDIDTCTKRFAGLVKEFSARRIYHDTISLGENGNIQITDTVWMNRMYGKRGYIRNLKFPTITETITITKSEEPKRQLYIGGNIFGDKNALQIATAGLLYKTKKDQIYQANIGTTIFDGSIIYGAGAYWKIKLKK